MFGKWSAKIPVYSKIIKTKIAKIESTIGLEEQPEELVPDLTSNESLFDIMDRIVSISTQPKF